MRDCRREWRPHGECRDRAMAAWQADLKVGSYARLAFVLGTAIGAAIPKHPVVLQSSPQLSTRHVSPLATRRGVGIALSMTF